MTLYTPRHYFVTHTNIPTLSCFVANLYSVNFLAAKSLLVLLSSKQTNNTHREMNALLIITKFTVGLILLPCLLLGPFFPVFLPLLDNFDSSEKKNSQKFQCLWNSNKQKQTHCLRYFQQRFWLALFC